MVNDLVCGMELKDISSSEKVEYNGKDYYSCRTICRIKFENEREKFVENLIDVNEERGS